MPRDGAIKIIPPPSEQESRLPAGEIEVGRDSEAAEVSKTLKQDITEQISAESLAAILAEAHDLLPEELDARVDELMAKARAEMQKIEKVTAKIKSRQGQIGEIETQVGAVDLPEHTRREPGTFALKVAEMQGKLHGMQEVIQVYEEERGAREQALLPNVTNDQELPPPLSPDQLKQTQIGIKGRRHSSEIAQENEVRAEKIIDETAKHVREHGYNQLLSTTLRERFKIQDRMADLSIQKNYDLNQKELDQVNQLLDQEKKKLFEGERQLARSFTVELKKFDDSKATEAQRAERALAGLFTHRATLHEKLEKIPNVDHPDAAAIFQELDTLEGALLKKQDELKLAYLKEEAVVVNKDYDTLEDKLHAATKAGDQLLVAKYQKELQAVSDRLTFIDARIKDREGSHVFDAGLSKTPSGDRIVKTAVGVGDRLVAGQKKQAARPEAWFIHDEEEKKAVKSISKRKGLFGGVASALVVLGAKVAGLFGGHHEGVEKPEPAAAVSVALPEAQPVLASVEKSTENQKETVPSVAAPENLPVGTNDLRPKVDADRIMQVIHKKVPIRGKTIDDLPSKATRQVEKINMSVPSVTETKGIFGEVEPSELDNLHLDELVKDAEKTAIKNVVKRHVDKAFAKIDLGFVDAINQVGEDAKDRIMRNERLPQKYIEQLASYSVESIDQFIDNAKKEVARLGAESGTPENLEKLGHARTYLDALKDARKLSQKKAQIAVKITSKSSDENTSGGVPVENATSIPGNTRKVPVAETTLPVDKGLREVVDKQNTLDSAYRDWVSAVDMLAMTKGAHKSADEIDQAEQEAETARVIYEALKKEALGPQ